MDKSRFSEFKRGKNSRNPIYTKGRIAFKSSGQYSVYGQVFVRNYGKMQSQQNDTRQFGHCPRSNSASSIRIGRSVRARQYGQSHKSDIYTGGKLQRNISR